MSEYKFVNLGVISFISPCCCTLQEWPPPGFFSRDRIRHLIWWCLCYHGTDMGFFLKITHQGMGRAGGGYVSYVSLTPLLAPVLQPALQADCHRIEFNRKKICPTLTYEIIVELYRNFVEPGKVQPRTTGLFSKHTTKFWGRSSILWVFSLER